MIGSIFILVASVIIEFVTFVFPTSTGFSTEITDSMSWLAGYAMIADPLVSMDALFFSLVTIIGLELIILSFRLIMWLVAFIPFFGPNQ